MTPDQLDRSFEDAVSISDEWTYRGFQAVVLENDRLRATVLPGHGAKVVELVSKWARRDLLFHHPRFDVRPPVFGANVDDWWTGGIDEVAPTGHACVVDGEALPFLGEFWSQAWRHQVVAQEPDRVALRLTAGGVITPLRLERTMELRRGEPFVRSRHRVTNAGPLPVPFMWGIHPGIAIRPGSRISAPATQAVFAEGHAELGIEAGMTFDWPSLPASGGRTIDLSTARAPDPPSWELVHAFGLSGGWLAVTDPPTRSGFAMAFDPDVFPVIWLWGVYGGWRGLYAAAVECWTSWPARLDQAIEAGRERVLEPGETLETEVLFIAADDVSVVDEVSADGTVKGA
jgi:hypothetical protein